MGGPRSIAAVSGVSSGEWAILDGVGPVQIRHLAEGAVEVTEPSEDGDETYVLSADEAGDAHDRS